MIGTNVGLVRKSLAPSVLRANMDTPMIQRNLHRYAKAELGLYLIMTSEAYLESAGSECSSSTGRWNSTEESEISIDDMPVHFYTPRPLPVLQQLRNWWRYR
ncbi:hypothetical protein VP01_532g3 [Puccinia sorghi]|uniref:Uncharacterized protein n=1 Tax=Puccinia sorghi TaxID=27349 RepID=A0A0L6UK62_9BASI|nr:hypothetical protein VP01_532g3 [Puccinia sorghi]